MDLLLIDYSEVYFKTITKKALPKKRGGRFIQIRNDDKNKEYLVFSPQELSTYHANIVERFCLINGIEGRYNERKDFFKIHDPEWVVVGGGMWNIDESEKRLRLFGESRVYGKFDSRHLKKKILETGKLPGYEVKIIG